MSKAKAIDLDEFLNSLEQTPESTFVQKLAQDTETVPTPEPTPAPETVPAEEAEKVAMEKIADAEAFGKIAAYSFWNELQKIAVGAHGYEPSAAQIPSNPAVQLSNQDVNEQNTQQIEGTINQLTMGGRVKGPQGSIQVNNSPAAAAAPNVVVDEAPVAADATKMASVIEHVYGRIFGGQA